MNDGSTDETGAIADGFAARYPDQVQVIHQENGGHGEGVNQGLRHATGMYFIVVDSDDWLDADALDALLVQLRASAASQEPIDMYVCNYVYEHTTDDTRHVVHYRNALPVNRPFAWEEIGHFRPSQFMIMHAVVYRTEVLRAAALELPRHTFYVDNVFVYTPLPYVKRLYYLDVDLYRYFIGRADQSVNEENMIRRVDQQLRVTRIILEAHDLQAIEQENKRLAAYMYHFLSIMLMISTIYLMMSGTDENLSKKRALWQEMKERCPGVYRRMRYRSANVCFLLPGKVGRDIDIFFYKLAKKIYKFS